MPSTKRPNFLIIVADDLGFSDIGCYGGEIRTPNLDKLASKGLRFNNFHTAAACSPTRSMLMSGTDHHIAGVGAMVEFKVDSYGERWRNAPGHEGYLLQSVAALPEVLQDGGYHTIMSGKWHLGREPGFIPSDRGFDRNFSFLHGCHNHYAYEPQFTKEDEQLEKFVVGMVTKHHMYTREKEYIAPEANFPKKKGGFYSTETFTDELLKYFKERRDTPELKEKPFFAYYAFTAPHWPLQAPKEIIDHYKGVYDDGPLALRERRLKQLKKLGLIPEEATAHPLVNPQKLPEWDNMTEEEQALSSRAMEAYAAMVEMIDTNVGRVLDQLEADGELDNTFVIFMSDNGAEGASYEMIPYTGPSLLNTINRWYNNELSNIGEPDSFVWYGSHWAQAATAPGRLYKLWTSEGGIRVPFILHHPETTSTTSGPAPGSVVDPFATVMDLMPTILDLAQVSHPGSKFRGRDVVPMRGSSWKEWMKGKKVIHDEFKPIGWELHGRAAMRIGDYKILFMPPPYGTGEWQLFNLVSDPGETINLAKKMPEKMEELKAAWEKYVSDTQVIWGDPIPTNALVSMDETEDPKGWMAYALEATKKKQVQGH